MVPRLSADGVENKGPVKRFTGSGPPGEDGGDHAVAPGADRPRNRWNATRWQRLTYRRICKMHDLNALRRKMLRPQWPLEVSNFVRP